jgi:hypothetical protein
MRRDFALRARDTILRRYGKGMEDCRHRSYGYTSLAKKLRYMSKIAAILARADIYA